MRWFLLIFGFLNLVSCSTAIKTSNQSGKTSDPQVPVVVNPANATLVDFCQDYVPNLKIDKSGQVSASTPINQCLAAIKAANPATATVNLPGGYLLITDRINIIGMHDLTIKTNYTYTGNEPGCYLGANRSALDCAWLYAGRELFGNIGYLTSDFSQASQDSVYANSHGMIYIYSSQNIEFNHVIVDGNRDNRVNTEAAWLCYAGGEEYTNPATNQTGRFHLDWRWYGENIGVIGSSNVFFHDGGVLNALCSSGIDFGETNSDIRVYNTTLKGNGAHQRLGANGEYLGDIADGITVTHAEGYYIIKNYFEDNTDCQVMAGSNNGIPSEVSQNVFNFTGDPDHFAGNDILISPFSNSPGELNYANFVAASNQINCLNRGCLFGIDLGTSISGGDKTTFISGATVAYNIILTDDVGIAAGGAAVSGGADTYVYGNGFYVPQPAVSFRTISCTLSSLAWNLDPDTSNLIQQTPNPIGPDELTGHPQTYLGYPIAYNSTAANQSFAGCMTF